LNSDHTEIGTRSIYSRLYAPLRVVLLAGILAYLAWQIYAGRTALWSLAPEWNVAELIASFLAAVLAYQCLLLAWLLMLGKAGYFNAAYTVEYVRIWWASYLYRYVPGKFMLLIERTRMGVAAGIPAEAGAAMTIIETVLAVVAGGLVSFLAMSFYADLDQRLLLFVVLLVGAAVLLLPTVIRWLCNFEFIRSRYPALNAVAFSSAELLLLSLPYLAHYLLIGLSFFLIARSVYPFTWLQRSGLIGVYALSHVIGLVTFIAPGGLGVREGALSVQLGRLLPAGIGEALAIGLRVWFTLIELLCYFVAVVMVPRMRSSGNAARPPSD
jgi:hypothetical protein